MMLSRVSWMRPIAPPIEMKTSGAGSRPAFRIAIHQRAGRRYVSGIGVSSRARMFSRVSTQGYQGHPARTEDARE